ncbi:LpqB family beta-propeller domain-containing protein [Microbacterium sp. ABRD28]|uniref:LpqB family beta-propeller domain-containing protein n=1 Tax=Microbacterium sp. ABRD28 TaxID=2268461 RepID=UPI000F553E2D|nr:LpqB family beta-propeller domain-containing protein [Microbacterium sp. ABRD28]AZC13496.1 hypothetical protein DT073_07075 [Microbacterium sp. ABRD28]
MKRRERAVRAIRALAVAVVAVLALTACAGLPLTGTVQGGRSTGEQLPGPDFLRLPDRPQPGATPEEIVDGFLRAGAGPVSDWARAREFLAPALRDTWDPTAGVIIEPTGTTRTPVAVGENAVEVAVAPTATVDATGVYEPATGGTLPLRFELLQQADGEWRISQAPDGIVLDRDSFVTAFDRYTLAFFDPTWEYLVPDERWFPTTNAPTRIAAALVDGSPVEWLAGSVVSAFPDSVALSPTAVPVSLGEAQVSLNEAALTLEQLTLDRMQTQLDESLASAGVTRVQMRVGSSDVDAGTVAVRSTRVAAQPLVVTADGFGFLTGDELDPVPGLSDALEQAAQVDALQLSPDRVFAAARFAEDGSTGRVDADGDVQVFDQRPGLTAPTIDPFGYVWTVPEATPSAVRAWVPSGPIEIANAWPGAASISAMALSRDGTRLAAAVTVGGRTTLSVAGVIRDGDGVPSGLGDPVVLGDLEGPVSSVAWLDDSSVAALVDAGTEPRLREQVVGGEGTESAAPVGADTLAGGNSASTLRVHTDQGGLFIRRGANWTQTAEGIAVLATQQGSPR